MHLIYNFNNLYYLIFIYIKLYYLYLHGNINLHNITRQYNPLCIILRYKSLQPANDKLCLDDLSITSMYV